MKKSLILVLAVMLGCLIFSTVAMAAPEEPVVEITTVEVVSQETVEESVDPGILPDSPFYFLKRFIEEIKLAFTFSPDSKIAMLMELAEVRIAELEALPEDKQAEFAESLTEAFVEAMEEAEELLEDEELEEEAVDEAVYDEVYESTANSLEVLQRVFVQVPEQGKKGIQRAIDVKLAKLQGLKPGPNPYAPGKDNAEDEVEELEAELAAELEEELDEDDQVSDYQDKLADVLEEFEDAKKQKEEILEEISELQEELDEITASGEVSEEEVSNLQDSITAQINLLDGIDALVAKYSGMLDGFVETANDEEDLEEVKEAFDAELDRLLEEIEDSLEIVEEAIEEISESIEDAQDEEEDDDDDNDDEDSEDNGRRGNNKGRR
ncbi:MAG: DUF5667 domain-containing protein [Bacillota bacterium]|nr:DUF5667 domain-containing protein [Bacillota bacterium]